MTSITKTTYVDNRSASQPKRVMKGVKTAVVAGVIPILLTGCEAPLNLEGVNKEQEKQVRRTDQFQAIAVSGDVVTVVGSDGLVITSDKEQLNWQRQELDSKPNLIAVETCPDKSLIALSMEHQLWISDDQGKNWRHSDIPTYESLISVTCAPDNSYWASGSFSTLMSSHDQGKSWNELSLNEDATISSVQFFDRNNAVAVGEFGFMARTEDGGLNWITQEPIPNEFFPLGSHFSDASTGWVAGLGGTILSTTDGGQTWNTQETPTESPIYNFYANDTRLFAFGDHGTVLEQKGEKWVRLESLKIPVYLRDGKQIDDKRLLVSGGWGALFTVDI